MKHTYSDHDCIAFLQWSLPRLGMRWAGFRKVRRQVCKRLKTRISELELHSFDDYREYLTAHIVEWTVLDSLCFVTISRFFRDKNVFQLLGKEIFPLLADQIRAVNRRTLKIWSAGCCSGEEPYSLKILWELVMREQQKEIPDLQIIASDSSEQLLQRAREAKYNRGSLKEVPESFISQAFRRKGQFYIIQNKFKAGIDFRLQDIRQKMPEQIFDLILCRNLVFTYFEQNLQLEILNGLVNLLQPKGFLIIGSHERLPLESTSLMPYINSKMIFRKTS